MVYRITLLPSFVGFPVKPGSTILESALAANIPIAHGCKNGDCGVCGANLKQGKVKLNGCESISQGRFLACQSEAESDISIEVEYYTELKGIENKTIPVKLSKLEVLGNVLRLVLRTPPNQMLKYKAGQYLNLSYQGVVRAYSIANIFAETDGNIELHIKAVPNGKMSSLLFNGVQENTLMRINGPCGTFFIREAEAPIAFLATGTGFAPVKAMIEGLMDEDSKRPIYLFWGGRHESDLYSDLPKRWAEQIPHFSYFPVLSRPTSNWKGKSGYVQDVLIGTLPNVKSCHIYACGSPEMIDSAKALLIKKGFNEKHFYFDAFTAAKDY